MTKHISARNKIAMSMSDGCVDTETVRVPYLCVTYNFYDKK